MAIKYLELTKYLYCLLLSFASFCVHAQNQDQPYILTLGIAQDGGYPHLGCTKQCCNQAWLNDSMKRGVVCLALVDPSSKKWWLFEATPDIKEQLHYFQSLTHGQYPFLPEGIFVTHAHIGHYTGLMELGREVMSTRNVPVFALPKMKAFLETNGPWSQLVTLGNIVLPVVKADSPVFITPDISVTAFTVPHRDEYSETAGFRIETRKMKYLFIPDINKWDKWDRNIVEEVKKVDIAFIDATFYEPGELPGRNMATVPHPFVTETMHLFEQEPAEVKAKVCFIHFNHTNPLMWDIAKRHEVEKKGFKVAAQGIKY